MPKVWGEAEEKELSDGDRPGPGMFSALWVREDPSMCQVLLLVRRQGAAEDRTMNNKLEEKLKKLLTLAERGIDGEKDNARELLEILLKKHGLTIEDIEQEDRYMFMFGYEGETQKQLLGQVISKVLELEAEDMDRIREKADQNALGAEMTRGQMVEVDFVFRVYREAMQEELKLFLLAFVSRHGLVPKGDGAHSDGKVYDFLDLEKIRIIARLMKPVTIKKEIADEVE